MEKHGLKQKFTPVIPQPEFLTANCLLSGLSNLPVTESKPSSQMSEVTKEIEKGWIREQHSTDKFVFSPNFPGARTSVPIPKIVPERNNCDAEQWTQSRQSKQSSTRDTGMEKNIPMTSIQTATEVGKRYSNSLENDQYNELSITCRKNRAASNIEKLQIPRENISLLELQCSKELPPLNAEYTG